MNISNLGQNYVDEITFTPTRCNALQNAYILKHRRRATFIVCNRTLLCIVINRTSFVHLVQLFSLVLVNCCCWYFRSSFFIFMMVNFSCISWNVDSWVGSFAYIQRIYKMKYKKKWKCHFLCCSFRFHNDSVMIAQGNDNSFNHGTNEITTQNMRKTRNMLYFTMMHLALSWYIHWYTLIKFHCDIMKSSWLNQWII